MPTVTLNTTQTTFVASAQPNNNFSFYPLLYVGTDPSFMTCLSFLKFDLSSVPVTSVDSALLELSVIVKSGASPSLVVVNRVTSALDTSTVTYNTQPTYVATPSQVSVTTADLYTAVQIDVTQLVNQWLAGTFPNEGFGLTNTDGTTLVQFATNNIVYQPYFPRLVLSFGVTPITGTGGVNGQLQGSPGGTIADGADVVFDVVDTAQIPSISYNSGTGEFTLSAAGNYYANWWAATDGAATATVAFSVVVDGTPVRLGTSPSITGQLAGDAVISVGGTPKTVALRNSSGGQVAFANTPVQANLSILKLS